MSEMVEVKVPNIGDFDEVEIIEVLVSVGDQIAEEDSLITVESDKASMEIPSSHGGTVKDVKVKVGDSIAEGAVVVVIEATAAAADEPVKVAEPEAPATVEKLPGKTAPIAVPKIQAKSSPTANIDRVSFKNAHASPAVRKFARELGVDLSKVGGTGRNARIIKGDVQGFVKQVVSSGASSSGAGLGVEAMPDIDFSKFGEVDVQALSKINKLTGKFLHRNWVTIPHITQFDEADITSLEAFRKQSNLEYAHVIFHHESGGGRA